MKTIVPWTKDILFSSPIYEISSISLEHELNLKENAICGDFILTGEYREYEVSVNKEKFLYRLPFSVEITENIIPESLNFEIEDFTYEIMNGQSLRVNIEFSVDALEKPKEEIEVVSPEEILTLEDDNEELERGGVLETLTNDKAEILEDEESEDDERVELKDPDAIINKMSEKEEGFVKYHIHIIREGDTIEKICEKYSLTEDLLREYNSSLEVDLGVKLIIPDISYE